MKITIESTDKIVKLSIRSAGDEVPARIWQGATDSGIPVHAYITRIAPEIPKDDPRNAQFQRELQEVAPPRPELHAIPLRMIL